MKKAILISFTFLLVMSFALGGCGTSEPNPLKDPPLDQDEQNNQDPGPTDENNGGVDQENPLTNLVNHFKLHNVSIGEKTVKAGEMIGAIDGFGIELNGSDIELYLFDPDTADNDTLAMLEDARTQNEISLWGITCPALMNGNIMMINYDEHPDKDTLVTIFNSY